MKEIREIKLVEQTTIKFVANDGKEFDNEKDCATYERRLDEEKCKKAYDRLHAKWIDIPFIDANGECMVDLITLESEKDFDTVVDYFITQNRWTDVSGLEENKPKEYPFTGFVVSGCEWAYLSTWDTTKVKEMLLKAAEML